MIIIEIKENVSPSTLSHKDTVVKICIRVLLKPADFCWKSARLCLCFSGHSHYHLQCNRCFQNHSAPLLSQLAEFPKNLSFIDAGRGGRNIDK